MQEQEIGKQIKRILKETDNSATVILYGSRARGEARADSDWDILILVEQPKVTLEDAQKFRHKLYELEIEIGESFSTFVYSIQAWNNRLPQSPFFKNVKRGGMIL